MSDRKTQKRPRHLFKPSSRCGSWLGSNATTLRANGVGRLLVIVCTIMSILSSALAMTEKEILEEFYTATNGDSWKSSDRWMTGADICQWYGVQCNAEEKISMLDLSRNNLNGFIPSNLWKLGSLRQINMQNNLLTAANFDGLQEGLDGEPRSPIRIVILSQNHLTTLAGISNAKDSLINLNVNKNQIETEFPPEIFECTNLESLYFAFNKVKGTLPTHIGRMTSLSEMYAFDNRLSGTIPTELGLLDQITVLGMGNNLFTGTLPSEMELMVNLRDISIHQVTREERTKRFPGLTGTLPSFSNMPNLSLLFFDGNSLSGSIPADFLRHNENLDKPFSIGLADNLLTGTLPKSLERFNRLSIDILGNRIGPIPEELCDKGGWMGGLVERFLCDAIACPVGTYNSWGRAFTPETPCEACEDDDYPYVGATTCGSIEAGPQDAWEILATFYQETTGPKWTIRDGWEVFDNLEAGGTIEDLRGFGINPCDGWFGVVCDPSENITDISLPNNELYGTIPSSIFTIPSLESFDISNNNVQIDSFEGVSEASGLVTLILSNVIVSSLQGIGALTELEYLYADGLSLQENLPPDLFELSNLKTLHLQYGDFIGPLPTEVGLLTKLEKLNVYGNNLSGSLPAEIGSLGLLRELELSENYFTGVLPQELSNLLELETIAIHQQESQANLSGPLPAFDTLPSLREVNLESNKFTGQIPNTFLSRVADKVAPMTVSLGNNELEGSIPASLNSFDQLTLNLENNKITSIPSVLCQKERWMEGQVGSLPIESSCNAILCPAGFWNDFGKETTEAPCIPCNVQPTTTIGDWDLWFGRMTCGDVSIKREKEILDKLFSTTGGRYWTKPHDNWLKPGVPICQREGVSCTSSGEILELRMSQFGLRGTIPGEIWELSSARQLAFTKNDVDISFEGIEKARALVVLKLSMCHLRTLDGLSNVSEKLRDLHLAGNQFNGTIPSEIFMLDQVDQLFLNNNHFSGTVPTEFAKMTGLSRIELHNNRLSGTLPTDLGLLTNLVGLEVHQNQLEGVLPTEIQTMSKLSSLNIANQVGGGFEGQFPSFEESPAMINIIASGNSFSGLLSSNFLAGVDPTLEITVDLSNNDISGSIPPEWSRFQAMNLIAGGNKISGIPEELCSKNEWNKGLVGLFGTCDAILCPLGSYAPYGRQTDAAQPCTLCAGGFLSAPYYGSTFCLDPRLVSERQILIKLYDSTNGPSWLVQTNWISDESVCNWYGIVCDEEEHVIEINLPNNLLESDQGGQDDLSEILTLQDLITLDLKGNKVDLDFSKLDASSTLQNLRMSGTGLQSLSGVSQATSLRTLHATNNEIRSIPEEIFGMTNLESLFLSYNKISGTISSAFGLMSGIKELYMFGNLLTGSLPTQLGLMASLVDLILAKNYLSGTIPGQLSSLPNLEQFSIYDQQGAELITGPVPSFSGATRLWHFDGGNNDLTGPLPDNFLINSVFKNETISIYLPDNEITGTIPAGLSRFDALDINLANNKILELPSKLCSIPGWMGGSVEQIGSCDAILCPRGTFNQFGREALETPCSECDLLKDDPYLGHTQCENFSSERDTLLKLYDETGGEFWSNTTGWRTEAPICSWDGVTCEGDLQDVEGIIAINLEKTGLSGTLPSEIWTLPSLQSVYFGENPGLVIAFNGLANVADSLNILQLARTQISSLDGISAATSLRELDISSNNLKGTFPEEILRLSNTLERLYMMNNFFYGTLPTLLGSMTKLHDLNLLNNDFLSTIPTEIGQLQELEMIVLGENLVYGQIPSELSNMRSMNLFAAFRFQKSGPRLSGTLPSFNRVPQLRNLMLEGNDIHGQIPNDFASASLSIEFVGLENNLLTGSLPVDLGRVSSLELDITANMITEIPSSYCDNPNLMKGAVGTMGCDALACPPGTVNTFGRAGGMGDCTPCAPGDNAKFYGSTSCSSFADQRDILLSLYDNLNGDSWYRNDFWQSNADVCDWYGVGCNGGHIVTLNLRGNNLQGVPGPELFNLPELRTLWLYANPLGFSFENIGSAKKLEDLRLDSTQLHTLRGIGQATSLISVDVGFTALRGTFPTEEIMALTNLRSLKMNNNAITGTLPKDFGDLEYLSYLRLDSNSISGNLPSFEDLNFLDYLDLSSNQLEGPVSKRFLQKVAPDMTVTVRIARNQLTGVVPEEFDRLQSMTLDLTDNQILGLPVILCDNKDWNNGGVGSFGCDAILCKPGTSNARGLERPNQPCRPCPQATYYGATTCSFSASSGQWNVMGKILASLAVVFLSFLIW